MLLTRTMDVATDTIEKAIALRYNARALIRFGSVEEGREKYREALEVISNSMLLDPDKVYFNSETLLYEAEDEFFVGQCNSGAQLVDEAARKARSVSRPPDVQYAQYVNGRIAALQNLLDRCNHTRSTGVVFPKVEPPIPTPMPQPDLTKAFKLSPSGRY